MKGLMKGDRTFDYKGCIKVSDYENNIHSDVIINPDKKGWFKRMFSSSQKTTSDFFDGIILSQKESENQVFQEQESKKHDDFKFSYKDYRGTEFEKLEKDHEIQIYHKVEGYWTNGFKVDDVDAPKYECPSMQYINNPLPSDCRFRTDLIALLNED